MKQNKYKVTISTSLISSEILYFSTSKDLMEYLEIPSYNILNNLLTSNPERKTKFKHTSTKKYEDITIEKINLKGTYSPKGSNKEAQDNVIKNDFMISLLNKKILSK